MLCYFSEHKPPSQDEISEWVKKEIRETWRSEGFDYTDQVIDKEREQFWYFTLISIGMIFLIVIMAYQPEARSQDWCIREVISLIF